MVYILIKYGRHRRVVWYGMAPTQKWYGVLTQARLRVLPLSGA